MCQFPSKGSFIEGFILSRDLREATVNHGLWCGGGGGEVAVHQSTGRCQRQMNASAHLFPCSTLLITLRPQPTGLCHSYPRWVCPYQLRVSGSTFINRPGLCLKVDSKSSQINHHSHKQLMSSAGDNKVL